MVRRFHDITNIDLQYIIGDVASQWMRRIVLSTEKRKHNGLKHKMRTKALISIPLCQEATADNKQGRGTLPSILSCHHS